MKLLKHITFFDWLAIIALLSMLGYLNFVTSCGASLACWAIL